MGTLTKCDSRSDQQFMSLKNAAGDDRVSKFALDDEVVTHLIKLGYKEDEIQRDVEMESTNIGKLYRKLLGIRSIVKQI